MESLNARALGTPTVTPNAQTLAAQLARIGRSDRRHGIRYFYCLGGHALAVAGYQPGPSLTTRRFPPSRCASLILVKNYPGSIGLYRFCVATSLPGEAMAESFIQIDWGTVAMAIGAVASVVGAGAAAQGCPC